jgi:hypothetical protein
MESPVPRRIGLDLDNTIIDYEALIREEVAALGLVRVPSAGDKRALRDALRAIENGEAHWTRLQARIYGPRLESATPFRGVVDFVRRASAAGYELAIVSHKSASAAADESGYDLHRAADRWLAQHGLVGPDAIRPADVFYEPTREAKIARLASLRLDAFIDDLAEVFAEKAFPAGVERWLFSASPIDVLPYVDKTFPSWGAIERHIFGD